MSEFEHAYDDRAEPYMQIGDINKVIAERYCGVEVDDTTHQRWRHMMGLLREIDTLADDTEITHDDVIEKLADFSEFAERYPTLAPGELEDEARDTMIARTRRVLKLGQFITTTESMPRYIALRLEEGRQSADLLGDAATEFVSSQPRFHDKYMPVMESLGMAANMLDSLLDGRMDYKDGSLSFKPDGNYYRAAFGNIIKHGTLGGRALFRPAVSAQLGVMAWLRMQNRLKHGMSETSNLRIFRR